MKRALLITMKNPVYGKVKTRLAASLGKDKVFKIYLALLRHTREVALQTDADRYLYYSDFVEEPDDWPAASFIKKVQATGDIGRRMSKCFEEILSHYEKVVLIGCDIPGLRAPVLEEAYEKLTGHDVVIGPAVDGGYYLIGMKKFIPAIFKGITWSTATVFEETIRRIEQSSLTWSAVETLADVDFAADWEKHGFGCRDTV